jgi:hypothetical protein
MKVFTALLLLSPLALTACGDGGEDADACPTNVLLAEGDLPCACSTETLSAFPEEFPFCKCIEDDEGALHVKCKPDRPEDTSVE